MEFTPLSDGKLTVTITPGFLAENLEIEYLSK